MRCMHQSTGGMRERTSLTPALLLHKQCTCCFKSASATLPMTSLQLPNCNECRLCHVPQNVALSWTNAEFMFYFMSTLSLHAIPDCTRSCPGSCQSTTPSPRPPTVTGGAPRCPTSPSCPPRPPCAGCTLASASSAGALSAAWYSPRSTLPRASARWRCRGGCRRRWRPFPSCSSACCRLCGASLTTSCQHTPTCTTRLSLDQLPLKCYSLWAWEAPQPLASARLSCALSWTTQFWRATCH